MPSADSFQREWLTPHRKAISDFSTRIEACIANSEWEGLAAVLDIRQKYLEQLLEHPIPEGFLEAVKQLVAAVLDEDEAFLLRVQEQKNISVQQQTSLERGRQAIRAYNNHF